MRWGPGGLVAKVFVRKASSEVDATQGNRLIGRSWQCCEGGVMGVVRGVVSGMVRKWLGEW